MDLGYSEADENFRAEFRAWLSGAVPAHADPPPSGEWKARREYDTRWQRRRFEAGEHPAHHYLKRTRVLESLFGTIEEHSEGVTRIVEKGSSREE
jgi:hypothetical protein